MLMDGLAARAHCTRAEFVDAVKRRVAMCCSLDYAFAIRAGFRLGDGADVGVVHISLNVAVSHIG